MESLFVWTLIFAGATIGLLGTFLIASERDLKVKRREVEELTSKLGANEADKTANQPAHIPQAESQATAELRAQNQELLAEVASLSNRLAASQTSIEELRLAEQGQEAYERKNQQLQESHRRLQEETASLRKEIAAYEARLNESTTHEYLKLETEVNELKRKLEESENAKRELTESRQFVSRDQQQQLETQIENLKRQLASEQEKVRELELARGRLEEMERLDQDLRGENRRLQEENARWEKQVAAGNESQKRLGLLRQYAGELQAKQASVIESQVQLQDAMSALVRLLDRSQGDLPLGVPHREVANRPDLFGHNHQAQIASDSDGPAAITSEVDDASHGSEAELSAKRKRRIGMFSVVAVLAVTGAVAAGFLASTSDKQPRHSSLHVGGPIAVKHNTEIEVKEISPSVPADTVANDRAEPDSKEPNSIPVATRRETNRTTPGTTIRAAANPAAQDQTLKGATTGQRTLGPYEITRSTKVYSGPSESTQLIASIEPGTKINVVEARDGWLGIRSKHGRPPGFIRTEAATRIGQN